MNRTIMKTQMEMAEVLMEVIDSYYTGAAEESEVMSKLKEICDKNKDILYASGEYGSIIQHKLGKKRMRVLAGALQE